MPVARLSLLLTLALAAMTAACSSDIALLCENRCDCETSCRGQEDIDACVAEGESAGEVASIYDCAAPFDEAIACVAAQRGCSLYEPCGPEFLRLERCLDGMHAARWDLTSAAP